MAAATLHSQRARPRCCGRGLAWKALLEAGWHGFPASAAAKRSEVAPRVSTPRPALLTGAKKVVRATPRFLALMRHRSRLSGPPSGPPLNPPREGRSHHRDPWREGHRVDEEAGPATSTTGGVPCARKRRLRQQQPESGAGRNRCRHTTLRRRRPVRPFISSGTSGFRSMSRTVSAFRHSVRSSRRGTLPYGWRPGRQFL